MVCATEATCERIQADCNAGEAPCHEGGRARIASADSQTAEACDMFVVRPRSAASLERTARVETLSKMAAQALELKTQLSRPKGGNPGRGSVHKATVTSFSARSPARTEPTARAAPAGRTSSLSMEIDNFCRILNTGAREAQQDLRRSLDALGPGLRFATGAGRDQPVVDVSADDISEICSNLGDDDGKKGGKWMRLWRTRSEEGTSSSSSSTKSKFSFKGLLRRTKSAQADGGSSLHLLAEYGPRV